MERLSKERNELYKKIFKRYGAEEVVFALVLGFVLIGVLTFITITL